MKNARKQLKSGLDLARALYDLESVDVRSHVDRFVAETAMVVSRFELDIERVNKMAGVQVAAE